MRALKNIKFSYRSLVQHIDFLNAASKHLCGSVSVSINTHMLPMDELMQMQR